MGLLGGKLKRMELLSARLGDVLSRLYLAAACVWRYEVEGEPKLLPLARAAIRAQLAHGRAHAARAARQPAVAGRCRWSRRCCSAARERLQPLRDRALLALAERAARATRC